MKKTFSELIKEWDDIKTGDIWEGEYFTISKDDEGKLKLERGDGYYGCSAIFINTNLVFELQRKQYSFTEAYESLKEGRVIESIFSGYKYMMVDGRIKYSKKDGEWRIEYNFEIDEIDGKWYTY